MFCIDKRKERKEVRQKDVVWKGDSQTASVADDRELAHRDNFVNLSVGTIAPSLTVPLSALSY